MLKQCNNCGHPNENVNKICPECSGIKFTPIPNDKIEKSME